MLAHALAAGDGCALLPAYAAKWVRLSPKGPPCSGVIQEVMPPASELSSIQSAKKVIAKNEPRQVAIQRARWKEVTVGDPG